MNGDFMKKVFFIVCILFFMFLVVNTTYGATTVSVSNYDSVKSTSDISDNIIENMGLSDDNFIVYVFEKVFNFTAIFVLSFIVVFAFFTFTNLFCNLTFSISRLIRSIKTNRRIEKILIGINK